MRRVRDDDDRPRTEELVRAMQQRHFVRFGTYPHVIMNHLARRKLDANRPELEAACGSDAARIALGEWHAFIDSAEAAVVRASGRGWYMDIHGHGHAKQRLEIGYLLTSLVERTRVVTGVGSSLSR